MRKFILIAAVLIPSACDKQQPAPEQHATADASELPGQPTTTMPADVGVDVPVDVSEAADATPIA